MKSWMIFTVVMFSVVQVAAQYDEDLDTQIIKSYELLDRGKRMEAKLVLQNALKAARRKPDVSSVAFAMAASELSNFFIEDGEFNRAEKILKEMLQLFSGVQSEENDLILLDPMFQLAEVYRLTDRPALAVPLLKRVAAIAYTDGGKENPLYQLAVADLESSYEAQGQLTEDKVYPKRDDTFFDKSGARKPVIGASPPVLITIDQAMTYLDTYWQSGGPHTSKKASNLKQGWSKAGPIQDYKRRASLGDWYELVSRALWLHEYYPLNKIEMNRIRLVDVETANPDIDCHTFAWRNEIAIGVIQDIVKARLQLPVDRYHPLHDGGHLLVPNRVARDPAKFGYKMVYRVATIGWLNDLQEGDIWLYHKADGEADHSALLVKDKGTFKILAKDTRNAVFLQGLPNYYKFGYAEETYANGFHNGGIRAYRKLEKEFVQIGPAPFKESDPYRILPFNYAKVTVESDPESISFLLPIATIVASYRPNGSNTPGAEVTEFTIEQYQIPDGQYMRSNKKRSLGIRP